MPAPKRRRSSSARSLELGAIPSKHELHKAGKIVTEWDDNRTAKARMAYQRRCVACVGDSRRVRESQQRARQDDAHAADDDRRGSEQADCPPRHPEGDDGVQQVPRAFYSRTTAASYDYE
jgi:hypothetical protein